MLERYERWLLARGLGTNSVVFHMRYLRAVYNKAADRGSFIASRGNPFYRRHIRQVATRKRALPRETLRRISDADLSELHPKYALARDLFMFSFYTRGMSFVDMIYLQKSDISDGVLTYKRKKTGQTLTLRIDRPCSASSTATTAIALCTARARTRRQPTAPTVSSSAN